VDRSPQVRRTLKNGLGYYDTELTKNTRDWKEVFDFAVSGEFELNVDEEKLSRTHNQWPPTPSRLR
jgi:hypothetical protein